MTHEVQKVTDDEARAIRSLVSDGKWFSPSDRIWLPIEVTKGTGRARCRVCGELIAKSHGCIRFGLQLTPVSRTMPAYIHTECRSS